MALRNDFKHEVGGKEIGTSVPLHVNILLILPLNYTPMVINQFSVVYI